MFALTVWVIRHRWFVIVAWVLLAAAGAFAAPHATSRLSYDFGLPGQPGYETNAAIVQRFGSGGENAPVLLVIGDGSKQVPRSAAAPVVTAVQRAVPGARTAGFGDHPELIARDGRTAVVVTYPRPLPNAPEPYAQALPTLQQAAGRLSAQLGTPVRVTGVDALNAGEGGGSSPSVLVETLFGGIGALVVLALVFGSFLALTPVIVAAASILTTFGIVWGLTHATDISFIVQYLLALIGLGVAIDYALLIVTRWREERGRHEQRGPDDPEHVPEHDPAAPPDPHGRHRVGPDGDDPIVATMTTAGRSVVFSGITVAVSLAALILLPVPFLRSVGFTGLLIPIISVIAAITLLPAVLSVVGRRLDWPHRRRTDPTSRLWRAIGRGVVRRRWITIVVGVLALLALATPVLGLRLNNPTNDSLASTGGTAATAVHQLESSGLGGGLTQPVEIVSTAPAGAARAVAGVADTDVIAPSTWKAGGESVVLAWTHADASSKEGTAAAGEIRRLAEAAGAQVGGLPAQNADFLKAVYGNAWWVGLLIVVVTYLLLARALRSLWLPVKALVLNVVSIGAAYGLVVLIWQHGLLTHVLFGQNASGAITVWVPIAVFAFLFGLSMDYEVFLLSRIREAYDSGESTDDAAVIGVARTGRLVTSAAVILFLSFVSLSRVPSVDVKILATGLALGIVLDATVVRGALAPALVAAFGRVNWWLPGNRHPRHVPRRTE